MREIIIACTFRSFRNDYISNLQRYFLKSLENQTYSNFKLVVTDFDDKNLITNLKKYKIKFKIYKSNKIKFLKKKKSFFSFSETIYNATKQLKKNKSILLHTNVEVIFDKNFFEEIIKNFEPNCSIYSFPNLQYKNIKDFKNKRLFFYHKNKFGKNSLNYDPNRYITECISVDGDLILKNKNLLAKFKNCYGTEDGYSKTLKPGFLAKIKKNIFFKSKVHNIAHNSNPNYRHSLIHDNFEARKFNNKIYKNFYKKINLSKKYYIGPLRRIFINSDFKIIGNLREKIFYKFYIFYFFIKNFFSHSLKKIQNNFVSLITQKLKKFSAKMIYNILEKNIKEFNKSKNIDIFKKENYKYFNIYSTYLEKKSLIVLPLEKKNVIIFFINYFPSIFIKNFYNFDKLNKKFLYIFCLFFFLELKESKKNKNVLFEEYIVMTKKIYESL